MNKKGQLGMNVAKAFLIGLLLLLVIGVVTLIVVNSLSSTSLATDSLSVTGESGGWINSTGYSLAQSGVYGFASPTITQVVNATNGLVILSGNYTVSGAGLLTNATVANWVNVNVSYTYTANNEIVNVTDEASTGVSDFFSNTATWLALLGVVIIILIISVVILTVNRFGSGRTF